MEVRKVKEQLIKRYEYVYGNALSILSAYICEFNKNLLNDLESFLLGDIDVEESRLYNFIEFVKSDNIYSQVSKDIENQIELLINSGEMYKTEYNSYIWKLLCLVRNLLVKKNDVKNLNALDEYFKISKYKNDGSLHLTGYNKDFMVKSNNINYSFFDDNLKNNEASEFVNYVIYYKNNNTDDYTILTEKEKQNIYLKFHDELPWDTTLKCEDKNCNVSFYVKEEKIFVDNNKYYCECPRCGNLVKISNSILTSGIEDRIKNRCLTEDQIFNDVEQLSFIVKTKKIKKS